MAESFARVMRFVREHPWALRAEVLDALCEVLARRLDGVRLTEAEIEARIGHPVAASRVTGHRAGAVQVLPLYGILAQRMNMVGDISGPGGTSTEQFGQAFRAAVADPGVTAIVLDVDSPGGSVYGTAELAQMIYDARGRKPIVAVANSEAGSAAYWIASQADELLVTPGGQVGSIGVLAIHEDVSKAAEQQGVAVSIVSAGKFKTEANRYQPLGAEARDAIQAKVDDYYDSFVKAVARGRGVAQRAVRDGFGEGRMATAGPALKAGMVDGIATLDETLARLTSGKRATAIAAVDPAAYQVRAQYLDRL